MAVVEPPHVGMTEEFGCAGVQIVGRRGAPSDIVGGVAEPGPQREKGERRQGQGGNAEPEVDDEQHDSGGHPEADRRHQFGDGMGEQRFESLDVFGQCPLDLTAAPIREPSEREGGKFAGDVEAEISDHVERSDV